MGNDPQQGRPDMPRWKIWLLASRPKTLAAAMAPVIVGCALAGAEGLFILDRAIAAWAVAVMIQIGTNLHNDVIDFERGVDHDHRLGPLRVTLAGLLASRSVKIGAGIAFGLAAAAGGYLVLEAGWVVLVIGVAAIGAGLAYTGGPFPLAYHGLGDPFVMIFFGFVAVCGTAYVQMGSVPPPAWLAASSVGATITALLVVNNVRDVETDSQAGRKTIPVVWGRKAGILEFVILIAWAYLSVMLMVGLRQAHPATLFSLATLPAGIRLVRTLERIRGPELNRALAGMSRLILIHASLLALGLLFPTFLR
jgi:1,4-dihydroxy-2-naphthoate polyprenyltransferase